MNAIERLEVKPMKPNSQDTRIALLEQSQNHIYETLIRIEKRFDDMEIKSEKRLDKIDQRFDKIDSNHKWLIGLVVTILFSTATLSFNLYHLFHKLV